MRNSLTKASEWAVENTQFLFLRFRYFEEKLLITFFAISCSFRWMRRKEGKNRLRRKTFYGFRWSSPRYFVSSRTVRWVWLAECWESSWYQWVMWKWLSVESFRMMKEISTFFEYSKVQFHGKRSLAIVIFLLLPSYLKNFTPLFFLLDPQHRVWARNSRLETFSPHQLQFFSSSSPRSHIKLFPEASLEVFSVFHFHFVFFLHWNSQFLCRI